MPIDKPTDGNTKQWDKLQNMRRASGTALTDKDGKPIDAAASPGTEQRASAAEREAENKRLLAGEAVGGEKAEETETGDEVETDDDGDGEGEGDEPETVQVAAHERAKPGTKKNEPVETPPAGTEAVEIDGKKVYVDAALAAAYRDSETARIADTAAAKDDSLVDKIVERVTAQFPKQPTAAEVAAKAALDAVTEAPEQHPMPDGNLQVTDPTEFAKQLKAHIDEQSERKAKQVFAERDARDAESRRTTVAQNQAQQIAWAKEQLGIQFYRQFKVLDDPDIKPLVDTLLNKKFDEIIASGVLDAKRSPADGEAFKMKTFNDIAAAATRQIVKLRGKSTTAQAPAPTPPTLATSAAGGGTKKTPAAPVVKAKEKYPTGSVSAMLAKHKATKDGPRSKPAA